MILVFFVLLGLVGLFALFLKSVRQGGASRMSSDVLTLQPAAKSIFLPVDKASTEVYKVLDTQHAAGPLVKELREEVGRLREEAFQASSKLATVRQTLATNATSLDEKTKTYLTEAGAGLEKQISAAAESLADLKAKLASSYATDTIGQPSNLEDSLLNIRAMANSLDEAEQAFGKVAGS